MYVWPLLRPGRFSDTEEYSLNENATDKYIQERIIAWIRIRVRAHKTSELREIAARLREINETVPDWMTSIPARRFLTNRFRADCFRYIVQEDAESLLQLFAERNDIWDMDQLLTSLKEHYRPIKYRIIRFVGSLGKRTERDCLLVLDGLNIGGVERSCINLANELAMRGYSVDICPLRDKKAESFPVDERIRLVSRKNLPKYRYKVAVNYCHYISPTFVLDLVTSDRRLQWIHNDLPRVFRRYPSRKWARAYARFDRFICVSDAVRNSFSLIYPELVPKSETILNPYDLSVIKPLAMEEPSFRLDSNFQRVVSIGSLAEAKGYPRAIAAMRMLLEEGCDFRWYILGEGKERPKLERLIEAAGLKDKFRLLGSFKNPFPILAQADLFAHFAYYEGFGLSVLEAVELGIPVIATDFGPVREVLAGTDRALVVPNTLKGIVDGLRQGLKDADMIRQTNAAGKTSAFSTENIFSMIESTLFPDIRRDQAKE